MSGMEDRERAFENKFAHDAELKFKAEARRNRLLGRWAAEQLGLGADEADAYVKDVMKADFEEAGDDDVLRKVSADFAARGVGIDDTELRRKMDQLLAEAVENVEAERKS